MVFHVAILPCQSIAILATSSSTFRLRCSQRSQEPWLVAYIGHMFSATAVAIMCIVMMIIKLNVADKLIKQEHSCIVLEALRAIMGHQSHGDIESSYC